MADAQGENPAQLKHRLNADLVATLAGGIAAVHPDFPAGVFTKAAAGPLETLELKQRSAHIAAALKEHLPPAFPTAAGILCRAMGPDEGPEAADGSFKFGFMPYLHFVEVYGLDHPDAALQAIERMTLHFTAEFAIRPYIERHRDLTMAQLERWAGAADWRLRRLVSEGMRPRLPWAMQLKGFIADPAPALALLDRLCDDPHETVRRSVANHLNDIAKDHPDLACRTAEAWQTGGSDGAAWTVRHGLRSLIKDGNAEALRILGFEGGAKVSVEGLRADPAAPGIGGSATLSFALRSGEQEPVNLVVDYILDRPLANGGRGRKTFKIGLCELQPGGIETFSKALRFKQLTTRTYHPGRHRIEIVLNGRIAGGLDIDLQP